jgi:ribosomal protein S27E
MGKKPLDEAAEVEIICPRCGYHTARTVARLRRRDTKVVCASCGDDLVTPAGYGRDNPDDDWP